MRKPDLYAVIDFETKQDLEILDSTFPSDKFAPPIAHEVIAISMATFRREPFPNDHMLEIKSLGSARGSEAEMLNTVVEFISKKRPCLVGWNNRGFDSEVLKLRCLKYGIAFPTWFQTGTKWESYRQRYSTDWQLDLMDFLTAFGASPKFSLDLASRAIGFPGKYGISGKDVAQYYADGRLDEIVAYCETDVAATAGLMLRVLHLTGDLSSDGFTKSAKAFLDYLTVKAEEKAHLREFLKLVDIDKFTSIFTNLEDQTLADNVREFPRGVSK